MSQILYVNYIAFDDNYVVEYTSSSEAIAFDNTIVIPDEISIKIDNTDKTLFDPRYGGSAFYGTAAIELIVELYDTDLERYIFRGKIKNLTIDDNNNQIELLCISSISDISEIICTKTVSSNITIAQSIYDILVDVVGIDPDQIVFSGFQQAKDIHTANQVYVNLTYADDSGDNNTTDCSTVLSELSRLGHCYLYTYQNLIYMWMYTKYAGEIGYTIETRDLVPKTYKEYFATDELEIKNSYRIAYDNAGTIAWASGSDASSILAYKEKKFLVPDDEVDSTTSADYNILFRNATGAAWCGSTALERFKDPTKLCEFTVSDQLDFIHVGTTLNLRFQPFYGEPVLVIEREHDIKAKTIKLKCIFLNTPVEVYSRDAVPPDTTELVFATSDSDGTVKLEWAEDDAVDHFGYNIYFTSTPGEWYSEICNQGQSPVIVKPTALNINGLIETTLTQLGGGGTYYFKVTCIDTSYNESDYSNVLSCLIEGGTVPLVETYGEDGVIPEPVYHDYLESNDWMLWTAEKDYTQWIAGSIGPAGPAGANGANGAKGDKGDKGDPGEVSSSGTSTANNFASFYDASGDIIKDSGSKAADFATATHTHADLLFPSSLYGVVISNNSGDANNDIDIGSGRCADSTRSCLLSFTAQTKRLDASWAAGTNQGGLFSGAKGNSTWYHAFLIRKDSDGTVDSGFDTSLTATNRPAGYTYYRYIGSVLTNSSGNIIQFIQIGDFFEWKTPVLDFSGNITNSATTVTLNVPLGIKCLCYFNIQVDTAGSAMMYLSDPDTTDMAPSASAAPLYSQDTIVTYNAQHTCMTNTSSQIRARSSYSGNIATIFSSTGYRNMSL